MTLRFFDGFKHYAVADIGKKWTSVSGTFTMPGSGPTGGGLLHSAGDGSGVLSKTLDAQGTWFVGVRWKGTFSSSTRCIFTLRDSGSDQFSIIINTDGTVSARRGAYNATEITKSTLTVLGQTWVYIETKVVLSTSGNSNGSLQVKVNGVDYISDGAGSPLGSLDTTATANATANAVILMPGANNSAAPCDWTDIYIADGNSSQTFLGDCKVETLYPTGNGNSSGWMGSDSNQTDNYALVNDTTADVSAEDYVYTSTVGSVDTYSFGDMSTTSGVVYGVQHNLMSRKDDAGARSIGAVVRHSSTDYVATTVGLGDTYADAVTLQTQNPGTSASWTISNINSAEFGVKLLV